MIHPVVERAAEGRLPSWAAAGEARRRHMARVAELMEAWGRELDLPDCDRTRWKALGYLHDCLREASPETLRPLLRGRPEAGLPGPLLHGPAAAVRLEAEGVEDRAVLAAVRWHTLGHAELPLEGQALYCADFLEPGRRLRDEWRAALRARMPGELDEVLREIVQARLLHLVGQGRPVRPETWEFWNRLAGGRPWAAASEL